MPAGRWAGMLGSSWCLCCVSCTWHVLYIWWAGVHVGPRTGGGMYGTCTLQVLYIWWAGALLSVLAFGCTSG